ncbi:unnamed protein product [Pelagomonas calceolata]|uniref:FIST C-domain domain-containing protein n=2 Tax=Pelagomonas calceolata TaxID=35677 RepID=A0A8J2X6T8_9STRA|nr:unnamed protein product [Pelagomonas calceolata]
MESYLALAAGVVAGAAGAACIIHWQSKKEKRLVRRSSSEKVQCNEFATTPSALLPTMQRVSTVIRDELPDQQVDRKIVYLVRHAQAAHNILEAAAKKAVKERGGSDAEAEEARKAVLDNPDNFDAALSVKGQSQASASGVELAELFKRTHYPPPECVLVSPLQRTLHTATLLFPDHPKMSAHERLREKRTGKPCDERRPAAEAAKQFPHISFDTIAWLDARSDDGWKFRPEFLEGNEQVEKRAATLLDLLRGRQETAIAVVAHKGYLRELYKATLAQLPVGRCSGAPALQRAVTEALKDDVGSNALKLQLDPIFGNAEVRVLQVAFPRGDPSQPPAISLKLLGDAVEHPPMMSVRLRDRTKSAKHAPAPHASLTRVAVGCSAAPDAAAAAEDAWWQVCQGLGGAAPELALLFCSSDIDGKAVAAALQRASEAKGGMTTLVGQTSQGGVLSKRGGARLGLVGLQHAAWLITAAEYPIIGAEHAEAAGKAAATALLADAARQSAGRVTSPPDLLLLMSAPVGEEFVLRGVQKVLGNGVTVFGGSSADESVLNHTEPGGWWQLCGKADGEAWRVSKNSVVMVGLYLRHPDACQCSIGSVYIPTKHKGVATVASGRVVSTIGGKPAVQVLDGWCKGELKRQQSAGGTVVRAAALFPLDVRASKKQTRPRLVHMKRVLPDGAIECFGPIGKGHELRLNSRKVADIPASVRELVVNAAKAATSPVKLALVDVCAGSASTLPDLNVLTKEVEAGLAAALASPPQFLCFFTFGEQGMVDGKPQHCNLMVNVALVG